ncbi:hypothetical protein FKM82_022182 [Ascaphus truei]
MQLSNTLIFRFKTTLHSYCPNCRLCPSLGEGPMKRIGQDSCVCKSSRAETPDVTEQTHTAAQDPAPGQPISPAPSGWVTSLLPIWRGLNPGGICLLSLKIRRLRLHFLAYKIVGLNVNRNSKRFV